MVNSLPIKLCDNLITAYIEQDKNQIQKRVWIWFEHYGLDVWCSENGTTEGWGWMFQDPDTTNLRFKNRFGRFDLNTLLEKVKKLEAQYSNKNGR